MKINTSQFAEELHFRKEGPAKKSLSGTNRQHIAVEKTAVSTADFAWPATDLRKD
jgi:hypothetical protein